MACYIYENKDNIEETIKTLKLIEAYFEKQREYEKAIRSFFSFTKEE